MSPFIEVSIMFALAAVIATVMQFMRLPLILGHLLTGILVGPLVLDLAKSEDTLTVFSKLGITALLFIVGLSLNPAVMRDVGKVSTAAGLGQVIVTSIVGFLIGLALGYPITSSLVLAVAFTFSSTIIVSKLLSDRNDSGKLYGKIAIGFLLVQDVVATLVLIFATAFLQGEDPISSITHLVLRGGVMAAILYIVSRWILPRITPLFAASQEFLFLFTIGWGVGLAAIFQVLGLGLEIGALAAGITLAASPYHYEISSKMKLMRDFFIILFFILLGSQLDLAGVTTQIFSALVYSAFILIGNPLIVMVVLGAMGYTKKVGFYAGLTVAQISEFSLLLILMGVQSKFLSSEILALSTLVAIITIAGSTIFILNADDLFRLLSPYLNIFERKNKIRERSSSIKAEAVLFGCHRVGQDFLATLKRISKKFLVVDFDPIVIESLEDQRIACRYGDASDNEFLDELNFSQTKLVVSTLPDIEANLLILSKSRKANSQAVVIVTAQGIGEANLLYEEGADYVILPHFLGGNQAALLLERIGTDPKKIAAERKRHQAHLSERSA